MAFVTIAGIQGKVYVPDNAGEETQKHRCRDCFSCQRCSDDRCILCIGPRQMDNDCTCRKECE